ncbi:hypothetical protein V5799_030479 [Amblyomma americanum]|uniref:Uncharacterized protein n=1 Tax=Amblyomma americanum TaxID=6943 RepID=A0AAQ4EN55_AMBAM
MSVVPERIQEFYEPPKPQVGTALPRYGVEQGYLVLEDLKTRDLPRPPPAGWSSAKRLGLVAAAALGIFAAVVAFALFNSMARSDDGTRPADPVLGSNGTSNTAAVPKFHIVTEIEDNSTVEEAGVESTAVPTHLYGIREATSKRRKPSVAVTSPGRIVVSPSRRIRLLNALGKFDEEDITVTFGDVVSSDV